MREYQIVVSVWKKEEIPANWQMAIIFPVYKKGDKLNCSNYRVISLLNAAYKIFTNTLARYLEVYTEEILGDISAGSEKDDLPLIRYLCFNK
jgi:hypothetical protein